MSTSKTSTNNTLCNDIKLIDGLITDSLINHQIDTTIFSLSLLEYINTDIKEDYESLWCLNRISSLYILNKQYSKCYTFLHQYIHVYTLIDHNEITSKLLHQVLYICNMLFSFRKIS